MNLDKVQFTEVFQYWSSEKFRKLQATLTKTANTIKQDALHYRMTPLLNHDEINTLKKAAQILLNFKLKIEHAKEIKAREEKRHKRKLKEYEKRRLALFNELLPLKNTPSHYVEIVSWRLALGNHFKTHFGIHAYFPSNKIAESELERCQSRYGSTTWKGTIGGFMREIHSALTEQVWIYDEEPSREKLIDFIHLVETRWMKAFRDRDLAIIESVKEEVAAQGFVEQCRSSSI